MKVLILGHTGQLGMAFKQEVIPNIEIAQNGGARSKSGGYDPRYDRTHLENI